MRTSAVPPRVGPSTGRGTPGPSCGTPAPRPHDGPGTGPAATRDGTPVKVLANVADGASARKAVAFPIEGVGLFRTELCFLDSTEEPSVEEQANVYGEVLEAMADKSTVVIRTLDAGSDKPI